MSIDRTQPLSGVSPVQSRETSEGGPQSAKGKTATTAPEVKGTQVSLSGAQSSLTRDSAQDINMQRVEQLKAAIRDGQLKMDTGKIADALLQDTQDYLKG
ncbi:flagellar biosynthesis anti-sigma factor FlgM [Nissabacter sp. SGAir0207]|uniref:flagellar biosynthesis anti-sigma factor FlgM n=1 Tax=Nissabacter sp. SGAir0207 TaxID=2126321 RepID=UPI0010CD34C6|nr:flagellar biosynthesis anti-sigma factor FlgM [Nissabacter sp. SGAir0207]QCR35778.1 anti-sigma-28 factor FlgM [Nissabacter sp. SGAir0207]